MADNTDWLKLENRIRATPIDLLRQGLRTQNWECVRLCHLMLTGENIIAGMTVPAPTQEEVIQPVKRKRGRPRKNQQVIAKQEEVVDNSLPPDEYTECTAPAMGKDGKNKLFTRASQHDTRPHPNTFVDDETLETQDIIKDRQVPASLLNNQRPPVQFFKVRCSNCGKVDKLEPGSLPYGLKLTKGYTMQYRCNSCIVGAKSGIAAEAIADDELLPEEE
jgi:hypothetical protein